MGVFLGFVDTVFTYTTGYAPFGDVALIVAVSLIAVTALALTALFVTRLVRRPDQAARVVEATLLLVPILLFALRGGTAGCTMSGWCLLVRWLPAACLSSLIGVIVAWGDGRWTPLPRLLAVAGATQLGAALAFGIRTDDYPTIRMAPVLVGSAPLLALGLAWRVRAPRWMFAAPAIAMSQLGLAIAVAWVLRSVSPHLPAAAPNAPGQGRPNVLLIVLDTVRADHLSLYGYPRRTSPNLDALARESLVFDRARANATYSLASHASLFTGLLPSGHGARPIPDSWHQTHPRLHALSRNFRVRHDVPTLAQDLKTLGYATAGISANPVFLARWTGLQQGFDAFFDAKPRRQYRFFPLSAPLVAHVLRRLDLPQIKAFQDTWRAPDVSETAIQWLQAKPTPFFLFLNYFDAHIPYDPPGGSPFAQDGVGRAGDVADYDGEIAFLDAHVGRLLQFMRDHGLLERTLVIITADHGEYFGEHGLSRHVPVLYEPVLSIPLIVRLPAASSSGRVARWTGLHEVRGLVREVVAGQRPLSILGTRAAPTALAEAWSGAVFTAEPSSVAVYFEAFKLLAKPSGPGSLYELTTDPGEITDLLRIPSPTSVAIADRMRKVIAPAATTRIGEAPEASPEALERLRALGYVQ